MWGQAFQLGSASTDAPRRILTPDPSARDTPSLGEFSTQAAQLLADRRCEDVRLLDVRGLSHVCDLILIGTGTSDRQMRSVAEELTKVGKDSGYLCFNSNRDEASTWIIVDFVDLVVNLFEPRLRDYYSLEELWNDAPVIPWENAPRAAPGSTQIEPGAP